MKVFSINAAEQPRLHLQKASPSNCGSLEASHWQLVWQAVGIGIPSGVSGHIQGRSMEVHMIDT